MVKLGQLVEGPALRALFDRAVQQAVEQKVTRGAKLRLDATVVEAPIHHPTDSRRCEDVVRVLGRCLKRLVTARVKLSFTVRDVSRQVVRQTRARVLRGKTRAAGKLVRIFEPYAQILRRGKPHRPAVLQSSGERRVRKEHGYWTVFHLASGRLGPQPGR